MTYLNDLPSGTGELVVLDAQDLSDVARVHLPRRVPVGFHGNWIPDSAVRI
jgi:carotenoid cleavage dioxygenase